MKKKYQILFIMLFFILVCFSACGSKTKEIEYFRTDDLEVVGYMKGIDSDELSIEISNTIEDQAKVTEYGVLVLYGEHYADSNFVIENENVYKFSQSGKLDEFSYLTLNDVYLNSNNEKLISIRPYYVNNGKTYYSSKVTIDNLDNISDTEYLTYSEVKLIFLEDDFYEADLNFTITEYLEEYNNEKINYITNKDNIKDEKGKVNENTILLEYYADFDAYKVVSLTYNKDCYFDYAIMFANDELSQLKIDSFIKFDKTLELGKTNIDAKVYDYEVIRFLDRVASRPCYLPKIEKEGISIYGWESSLDQEIVHLFPAYTRSLNIITYNPIWNQEVNVSLDFGGNLAYENRDALVNDFIKDFSSFSKLNPEKTNFKEVVNNDNHENIINEFFTSLLYENKWNWMLEEINKVKDVSTLSANQLIVEVHNYINCLEDYSEETVYNAYQNLDIFKIENNKFTFETELPIPSRDGYVFEGWLSSVDNELHTTFPGYEIKDLNIVYKAQWSYVGSFEFLLDHVSDVATSFTVDTLPSEYEGFKLKYESSNPNLYVIGEDGKAYVSRRYQTHLTQTVTVRVIVSANGIDYVNTKDITINPVVFDEMENPKAVYFSVGSASNYTANSQRYKEENTLFSEKFRENMDMIYYAFAIAQADGTLTLNTTYLDRVLELKNDGIRVLMVIDGVNKGSLNAMVALSDKDDTRKVFVDNIMGMIKKYNFDGVDIDWEYPGVSSLDTSYFTTERDQMNLNKLLRDIRNTFNANQAPFGSPYILSAAIPATSWGSVRYDFNGSKSKAMSGDKTLGGIDDYCDYVNMMSYDSNKESHATHLAPCYTSLNSQDYKFGCVYGTNQFVRLGLTKSKIILGSAAYGKAYLISGNVNMSSKTPALGMAGTLTQVPGATGSFASGTIYYSGIQELLATGKYEVYTEYNGGNVVGSYLYSNETKIYITFDSRESVIAKCKYAKANGMGIMVWAYGEDSTDTVVDAICDNL